MADENQLMEAIKGIRDDLGPVVKRQAEEMKRLEGVSDTTRNELKALEGKLDNTLTDLQKERERNTELEAKFQRIGGQQTPTNSKSLGEIVIGSDEFKRFKEFGGRYKKQLQGEEAKAVTSVAGSAGVTIRADRQAEIIKPGLPDLRIRALIAQGNTESNAVEFVRENLFTNNAGMVAEAAQKPESDLTFAVVTANVRTVAHFIKASKQILDDTAQLQSYIDARMVDGLNDREDAQLLSGDNTGQNLNGLITQATAYTRNIAGDTKIDTIRRAQTQIKLTNLNAEGIVINPADWEAIELAKGTDNRYIWTSVNDGGFPRIFRIPVVESALIGANQFLMGAFRSAAQIFDRMEAEVEIFEQDGDNVQKNMITIRAEKRLALVVYRPLAFVKGALTGL